MFMPRRLLAKLWFFRKRTTASLGDSLPSPQINALIEAHGAWLALLATILERERIIGGSDLARALSEFAEITAQDRPAEAQILAFWASRLQDTAATIRDFPSVH